MLSKAVYIARAERPTDSTASPPTVLETASNATTTPTVMTATGRALTTNRAMKRRARKERRDTVCHNVHGNGDANGERPWVEGKRVTEHLGTAPALAGRVGWALLAPPFLLPAPG
jgi:hypothetical protein